MGFDKRGYYYRARKENGRVVRQYFGAGEVAHLVARMDEIDREKRQDAQAENRAIRAEVDALDEAVDQFNEVVDLVVRAVLNALGFEQHNRGEWRKRRGR